LETVDNRTHFFDWTLVHELKPTYSEDVGLSQLYFFDHMVQARELGIILIALEVKPIRSWSSDGFVLFTYAIVSK
jgi:hypothetical protein